MAKSQVCWWVCVRGGSSAGLLPRQLRLGRRHRRLPDWGAQCKLSYLTKYNHKLHCCLRPRAPMQRNRPKRSIWKLFSLFTQLSIFFLTFCLGPSPNRHSLNHRLDFLTYCCCSSPPTSRYRSTPPTPTRGPGRQPPCLGGGTSQRVLGASEVGYVGPLKRCVVSRGFCLHLGQL